MSKESWRESGKRTGKIELKLNKTFFQGEWKGNGTKCVEKMEKKSRKEVGQKILVKTPFLRWISAREKSIVGIERKQIAKKFIDCRFRQFPF